MAQFDAVHFASACHDVTGGNPKILAPDYQRMGALPVIDQGREPIAGYVNDLSLAAKVPLPCILFGDHTRSFQYVDHPFALGADGVKVLQPTKLFEAKFLFHALRAVRLPTDLGYSRHFKYLKRAYIPCPPILEQRRIADILDRADALKRKRQQALQLADDFLRATFLDMFGDPATNPKGWPLRALGEVSTHFTDGPFGSNLKSSHYTEAGVRVVRLQNVGVGRFVDQDKAYVSEAHALTLKRNLCFSGDLIIATLGDPNLRACILPPQVDRAVNKADCVLCRLDKDLAHPEYVVQLLNAQGALKLVSGHLHGQTRVRIPMGTLRDIPFPMPPIAEQAKFEALACQVKAHHSKLVANEKQLCDLAVSCQAHYLGRPA